MIAAAALGMSLALAVVLGASALLPGPPPLERALESLHARPEAAPPLAPGVSPFAWRVGAALGARRLVTKSVAMDLAVTGRDESWLVTWAVCLAALGAAVGPALEALASLAGASLPWLIAIALSLLAGSAAVAGQLLSLKAEAAQRRASFGFALSSYLDLVVVSMAAGRGTEGALSVAAESGSGWPFEALRRALQGARLRGITPWAALDELGTTLGIGELRGLASSIELAGSSGARVRSSVAARARALRSRGLADARSAAEAATERMSVPVALLVLGFVVLIGYPAIVQITTRL